ncbi:predicted protein [Arabidopsis lyrata subsp. lyrata]|uniref:Predicted protein n=1 Tax=Arabidopsis lyrata subsp. lyrata TaxID=81972 RepID=D7LPE5_ARALL|nr:predicted protein [Arabidopsis lyrata subsp. lyrata]
MRFSAFSGVSWWWLSDRSCCVSLGGSRLAGRIRLGSLLGDGFVTGLFPTAPFGRISFTQQSSSPARVLALLRWLVRFALLLNGGFVFSDRDSQWCSAADFLDLFLPVHGGRVFWLLGSWWSSKGVWRHRLRLILCGGCRRGPPRLRVSSLGHGSKCGSSVLQFDSECGGLVLLRCGNGFYVHSEKFSPCLLKMREACLVKIARSLVMVFRLNRGGGSV